MKYGTNQDFLVDLDAGKENFRVGMSVRVRDLQHKAETLDGDVIVAGSTDTGGYFNCVHDGNLIWFAPLNNGTFYGRVAI